MFSQAYRFESQLNYTNSLHSFQIILHIPEDELKTKQGIPSDLTANGLLSCVATERSEQRAPGLSAI